MRVKKYIFSPVEDEYLIKNKKLPISQLSLMVAKPVSTTKKRLKELTGEGASTSTIKKNKISYIGKRPDLNNIAVRSRWEANIFRWLLTDSKLIIEYEPTTFSFAPFGILKGTVSYTPDFKCTIENTGEYFWIEVKGWIKAQDKTKLRRFKKFFPDEFQRLKGIPGSENTQAAKFFKEVGVDIIAMYNDLNKACKDKIKNWE